MALYKSISGTVSNELLAAGQNKVIKEILVSNTHASTTATVDLYIHDATSTYYFLKGTSIPAGVSLVLDNAFLNFNNSISAFGLYIKLGAGTVDVVINTI
tara:strand:- start:49 stop:348 length:300 start_codon:yes stop_codon:yes gene_type:complete